MQAATLLLPPTPQPAQPRAAALDVQAEWESFSRPLADGSGRWESWLGIEGMYCAACTLAIEQALAPLPGVHEVAVSGAAATARIVWSPQQGRPSQWLQALRAAGYGGVPAGDQVGAQPRLRAQRKLLWRWLVAGFCMMQVMMYAVPAYLADPGEMTPDVAGLLRWASWLLTLPVVLFSCGPFFASARRDLRARRIGMDVPVALGIVIAFGASTAATFDPQGPLAGEVWFDSLTMFVFFLLSGRLLEQRLRDRTAGALETLLRRLPQAVERLREDGGSESVAVRSLVVGDRIRVRAGEAFPADGRVLEGESQVDEALLTGESTPLPRGPGAAVLAGSHNLAATLVVRVERTGAATRFAEIVALMERAATAKPRLAQLADRFASPFLFAVLLAAGAAAWWWWPQGPGHALGVAVAVLIVTCPCALALATPAATLAAAGALARRGILVRRLEALEDAADVNVVLFDKTGTLTVDGMAPVAVCVREGASEEQARAWAGALAAHSLHPVARALAREGAQAREVVEHAGQGMQGIVEGVGRVRLGSKAFALERRGRCANPPYEGSVYLADDEGWVASFVLEESLRPRAADVVAALQRAGMRTEILSGDEATAVEEVAARVGIPQARGGQSPQDKLDRLSDLQRAGQRVAMVGDGMNDAPVLAQADISVALGQAVPIAQARCDFIVPGGQIEAIPLVLLQARRTRRVVRQNLAWAAGYNFVCVPLALAGQMPPWLAGLGMAASSLLVVLNAARLARLPGDA